MIMSKRERLELFLGLCIGECLFMCLFWVHMEKGKLAQAEEFIPISVLYVMYGVFVAILMLKVFSQKPESYFDSVARVFVPIGVFLGFISGLCKYVEDTGVNLSIYLCMTFFTALLAGCLIGVGLYFRWPKTWWPRKRDRVSQYVEDPNNPPSWKGLAEGD